MKKILKLVPASKPKTAPKKKLSAAEEILLAPMDPGLNFDEITRLMGGSAANGDKNDPVVFQGTAELQMHQLIAKYGFERFPFTYGELFGLCEYCNELEAITGRRSCPPKEQVLWQFGSFRVWGRTKPEILPAARLYADDDIAGLARLHTRDDTLTQLGKDFKEVFYDDE
jgi:hypothetical protein